MVGSGFNYSILPYVNQYCKLFRYLGISNDIFIARKKIVTEKAR